MTDFVSVLAIAFAGPTVLLAVSPGLAGVVLVINLAGLLPPTIQCHRR